MWISFAEYIIDKNRANLPSLSFEGDLILPPETILKKSFFVLMKLWET